MSQATELNDAMGVDPEKIEELEKEVGGEIEPALKDAPEPAPEPEAKSPAQEAAEMSAKAEKAESGEESSMEERAAAAERKEGDPEPASDMDATEYQRLQKAEIGLRRRVMELSRKNREQNAQMQAGAQIPQQQLPPQPPQVPPQQPVPRGTQGAQGQVPVQLEGPDAFVPREAIAQVARETLQQYAQQAQAAQNDPRRQAAAQYQHVRNSFVTEDPMQMQERETAVRTLEQGYRTFGLIVDSEYEESPVPVNSMDDFYNFLEERDIAGKLAQHSPAAAALIPDYVDLMNQPLTEHKLRLMTSKLGNGAAAPQGGRRESAPLTLGQKPRSIALKGSGDTAPAEANRARLDELLAKAGDPLSMNDSEMKEFEGLVEKFG